MLGVHVGLDLENKSRKGRMVGSDRPFVRVVRPWRRRHVKKGPEEEFDPEIVEGTPKKNRGHAPGQKFLPVEGTFLVGEERDFVHEALPVGKFREDWLDGRVVRQKPPINSLRSSMVHRLVKVDLLAAQVPKSPEPVARSDRPVEGERGNIERTLDVGKKIERVDAFTVHLVDEGENREGSHAGDFEELKCLGLDPLRAVKEHHHRIDRFESPEGVFAEILVPWRIENVQGVVLKFEREGAAGDADAPLALDFHPVAGGITGRLSCLDRPRQVNGPPIEKKLFGQGRFSGIGMADDGEGPSSFNFLRKRGFLVGRNRCHGDTTSPGAGTPAL